MRMTTRKQTNRTGWMRASTALALSALLAACGGPGTTDLGANNGDAALGEPGALVETPDAGGLAEDTTATDDTLVNEDGPEATAAATAEMASPEIPTEQPMMETATPAVSDPLPTAATTGEVGEVGDLPPEGAALTVSDIMQNPELYYGQEVTVVGEAQRIFGSSAFKLDEDSFLSAGIDNDLVVISAGQDNPAVETTWLNNQIQVTGRLRQYVQAEFEQEFDWFQPGESWEAEIEEAQPFLIAETITRLEEGAFETGLGQGVGELEGAPEGALTVAEVTGDGAAYAGQSVTVQGEVQEVYTIAGSNVLRLDEDALLMGGIDNDLIVVGAPLGDASLDEDGWLDSIVRVTGTVRDFNRAELEQEFGLVLDDPAFEEWEGEPVLIADAVEQVR